MNFQTLIDSGRILPLETKQKIFIAKVDPELASILLAWNFADNRAASKEYVSRLATEMREGRWKLGNDAITVDAEGRLVNGQHRLNAVVQSKTSQLFLFLVGVDAETAQILDIGKKRSMDQRITVSGVRITPKECAVIRHAMNDYSIGATGTMQYGYARYDELVKEIYLRHSEFLRETKAQRQRGSAFFWSAALKMYAEMVHYGDQYNMCHDMSPMERCKLWLDLVEYGYSPDGISIGESELAAIKLKNMKENRRADKNGSYWADKNAYQFTVCAAYKFMTGEKVQNLTRYKTDPFHDFLSIPSTNVY